MAKQIMEVEMGEDPANGPSLPAGDGRRRKPSLRIHDPGVAHAGRVAMRGIPAPGPVGPQVALCEIDGVPYVLRHWTADEWERTPSDRRPPHVIRGDRDDRFAIEPDLP